MDLGSAASAGGQEEDEGASERASSPLMALEVGRTASERPTGRSSFLAFLPLRNEGRGRKKRGGAKGVKNVPVPARSRREGKKKKSHSRL